MPETTGARLKALLVHLYTASTVILLLLAMQLLLNDEFSLALFVLLLAVVIDATDGTLARRFRVKDVIPEFDGRRLDDIIDYISFTFLPVVFMLKAEMLLAPAVLFGSLPLLASAFGFARVDAKLDNDGFFVGFPSYWNILLVYFYLLEWPAWLNTLVVIICTILVFIPTRYIYITRFPHLKWLNYGGSWLCGIALLAALLSSGATRLTLTLLSLTYPVFYTVYSLLLDWRARRTG